MEEPESVLITPNVLEDKEINDFKWSVNITKMLIDLYKKYRNKVGTLQIRSIKQMWLIIAKDLSQEVGLKITANQCENKWRVLDRNYKKFIENKTSTGRGRKYFEFAEDMESIYGNKRNVFPELLLSTETVHLSETTRETPAKSVMSHSENSTNDLPAVTIRKNTVKQRCSTFEKIRKDRLLYQEKKLEIEMLKLEEIKRRNDLIEERNNILREKKCNCCNMSIV